MMLDKDQSGCEFFNSDLSADLSVEGYASFLARLPQCSVDLALTDPPYNISRKTGFSNTKIKRYETVSMDFGKWDTAEIDLDDLARSLHRVLRDGGTVIIWYDIWKVTTLADALTGAGFGFLRQIIWEKTNPVPLNARRGYYSNSREMAVVAVKGQRPTFHSEYDNGVYEEAIPRPKGGRIHPTQKPELLFAELIRKHSNPGDLVIDPFLGSGTTAVAAFAEGRNFKGCDIDPEYIAKAGDRLGNSQRLIYAER